MTTARTSSGKGAATAAPTLNELGAIIRKESQEGEEQDLARAMRLGSLLRQARAQVPHGTWRLWLKKNYSGSPSTAERQQRIADPINASRVTHCKSVRAALSAIAKPKPEKPKRTKEAGRRLRALHALRRENDSSLLQHEIDVVKMVGLLEQADLPALGFGDADDETVVRIHAEYCILFQWLDRSLTVANSRLSSQKRIETIRKLREGTEGRTPEEIATALKLADKIERKMVAAA